MRIEVFGRSIEWSTKRLPPLAPLSNHGGWWPFVRDPFPGAWQRNAEIPAGTAMSYSAVYACVTLIAADIAKLCLRLVEEDDEGIWTEVDSPAFSPVLRKPNRYQNIIKFIEQWLVSKLTRGNTYVLKQRDNRGVVVAMYVLDPTRVQPLVTPDGAVYYRINRDDLSEVKAESVTVPASEMIHDIMCALYHPLIGVTPIYACGLAAQQGLSIQSNSQKFFSNGSNPSGFLTAPGSISDATALRLKAYFEANFSGDNVGKVAVGGDGLTYAPLTMTAVDAELVAQLKLTAETVCSCFRVPPYMIGVGPPPPYANVEPLLQQYYSQCLQSLITSLEKCLDEGLGLMQTIDGKQYGCEFDIDDLIWMDTATKSTAAQVGIGSGAISPNEARKKFYGFAPTQGGDTPYMQNQMWPLKQLSERPTPATPALPTMPVVEPPAAKPTNQTRKLAALINAKAILEGLYVA